MRQFVRDLVIKMIRDDLIHFLDEREDDLIAIFREEMQVVDDRVPDEQTFVDLRMAPMGEEILRGVLQTLRRFLKEQV